MVVSELRGEKIDIIPWNDEPARFVAKALAPARVREVLVDDENEQATVIVPDDQLVAGDRPRGPERAARDASSPAGASTSRASPSSPRRRPRSPSPAARATTPSAAAAPRSSARAGAARTARCPARATAASRRIASSRREKRRPPEPRTSRSGPASAAAAARPQHELVRLYAGRRRESARGAGRRPRSVDPPARKLRRPCAARARSLTRTLRRHVTVPDDLWSRVRGPGPPTPRW